MNRVISRSGDEFSAHSVAGWRQLTVVAIFGVRLAACSSLGGVSKDSPEEVKVAAVTKQVEARWDALIAGDVAKSYSFLSAGSQATTALDLYKAKARLMVGKASMIDKVECDQELCKVSMRVTIDTRRMKGLPLPETETWILEGGEYRYVWLL